MVLKIQMMALSGVYLCTSEFVWSTTCWGILAIQHPSDTAKWQENNTGNKLWLELGADFLVCFSNDDKQYWCWFSSNYAPQHECCLSLLSHQYTPGWPCRWLGPLARSATASGPMAIFEDHRAYCHRTSLLLNLNSVYCSWFLFCVYCYSYYCHYETLLLLLL